MSSLNIYKRWRCVDCSAEVIVYVAGECQPGWISQPAAEEMGWREVHGWTGPRADLVTLMPPHVCPEHAARFEGT